MLMTGEPKPTTNIATATDTAATSTTTITIQSDYGHFSRWTWVSPYQNVCILDFIGAKDDGGGEW